MVILSMSLLPSMVELHQWWDIYCHHWSEFFTARNFGSLMWEAYQAMKQFFRVCHCCQAWLNCTSGEIFTAITGRSFSLLGTLVLLCVSNETVILIMSLLPSMVELHQWWDTYCHHWSEFFTARNFSSLYVRGLSSNETVVLSMSLFPSMVELHQWWDIYCYHWSEFFTARNFTILLDFICIFWGVRAC